MKITAEQKNSRQSPRKVRLIANQVKKLSLQDAFSQLALMNRKSTIVLLKVMRQAVANAVNNHHLAVDDLEIDNILVKAGTIYKRWQPVSRGRAHKILKRTSHVEVILKTKTKKITEKVEEKKVEETKVKKVAKSSKTEEKKVATKKVNSDKKSIKKATTKKKKPVKKTTKSNKK